MLNYALQAPRLLLDFAAIWFEYGSCQHFQHLTHLASLFHYLVPLVTFEKKSHLACGSGSFCQSDFDLKTVLCLGNGILFTRWQRTRELVVFLRTHVFSRCFISPSMIQRELILWGRSPTYSRLSSCESCLLNSGTLALFPELPKGTLILVILEVL